MRGTNTLEREVVFHRYYDPATVQFLSVDPAVNTTGQPYEFTGDNPVNGTDPSGDCVFSDKACIAGDTALQLYAYANGGTIHIDYYQAFQLLKVNGWSANDAQATLANLVSATYGSILKGTVLYRYTSSNTSIGNEIFFTPTRYGSSTLAASQLDLPSSNNARWTWDAEANGNTLVIVGRTTGGGTEVIILNNWAFTYGNVPLGSTDESNPELSSYSHPQCG